MNFISSSVRFRRSFAIALAASAMFGTQVAALGQHEPPTPIDLTVDLNGDGVPDSIVAAGNELVMTCGATARTIVRFYGQAPEDEFGAIVLVVPDVNGDGDPELLVAAPNAFAGQGALYLFRSPWVAPCTEGVSAADADLVVRVPDADSTVSGFAENLHPMFDVDGDELGEIQISARTIRPGGESSTRIYVFSPSRGQVLVQFDPIVPSLAPPAAFGDVDADSEVTVADLVTVLENFAIATSTRKDGDLDGDGMVGLADLTEVVTELGRRGFEALEPPQNASDAVLCDLGTAGPAWVTPRAPALLSLRMVASSTSNEPLLVMEPVPGYFPPGFSTSGCESLLDGCNDDPRVREALRMLYQSCGSSAVTVRVSCLPVGPAPVNGFRRPARLKVSCFPPPRMQLCLDTSDDELCRNLAHEIVHVAQVCEAGFLQDDCNEVVRRLLHPLNQLCQELEAHRVAGLCDPTTGSDIVDCCELLCRAYREEWGWRLAGCDNPCEACCTNHGLDCCDRGQWLCGVENCPGFPEPSAEPQP
jgi:hypothetical protein